MSGDLKDLTAIWHKIAATAADEQVAVDRLRLDDTGIEFPNGTAWAGLNRDGRRHVLIPVAATEPLMCDRQSRGIHMEVLDFFPESGSQRFLDIWCPLPAYDHLFSVVATEMLKECEEQSAAPVPAAQDVLARWRALLAEDARRLLGTDKLAALAAELHTLLQIGLSDTEHLLAAWQGPDNGHHDLVSSALDIEVKSTLSPDKKLVHVAGLSQLAAVAGVPLYLMFVRLTHHPGGNVSVPSLIHELIKLGCSRARLYEKMAVVGYHINDEPHYQRICFDIGDQELHLVSEGFPRLTKDELIAGALAPGVGQLKYVVDLDRDDCEPLATPQLVFDQFRASWVARD